MKYNDNGEYKDIYIKTFDTLPVGAIVEYTGSTIPDGWTDIGNNQIQKTSQYIEGGTGLPSYFTTETDTGMKWIDDKKIYSKTLVKDVDAGMTEYKVTESSRAIQDFTDELSNWYVRRCRERFWGSGMEQDKINAYMTLYTT